MNTARTENGYSCVCDLLPGWVVTCSGDFEQFKKEVPRYMIKHLVRPGITGWAQVNDLRGDTSIPERIKYDIYYIEHWSMGFDLKILLISLLSASK